MLFSSILFAAGLLVAETPDTLQTVTIVADRGVIVSKTDTISLSNTIDITQALTQIPGIYLGDYGGLAGLKTVSLRGLGSAHTALYLDGVRLGNMQSGQADLGMLGIENFDAAVVDYAQNSVSFSTARPVFNERPVAGIVRFRGGSFDTYEPSARVDFRLSDKISLSANAAGIFSKGTFPYGNGLYRENNDISQLRGGVDLFGDIEGGDWHAKAFCNSAERGTPGSTTWPSTDRQKDRNAFAQALLRKQFSPLYSLNLSAKAAYDNIFYQSSWGDSDYTQTEFQLNSAHKFQILPWWSASISADLQWDGLISTYYQTSRLGVISALATAVRLERFKSDFAVEYQGAFDKGGSSRFAISPSFDVRYAIFDGLDFVAFGRRAYRIPTFNELYYPGYGNADLLPEDAWMADAGVEWHKAIAQGWNVGIKADGFYNYLKNKIISAPNPDDSSIWLPYNVGVVEMSGADLQASLNYANGDWQGSAQAKYSYLSAIDKTPDSYNFGQQIPYVAKHTLILSADARCKGWILGAVWNMRSGRMDASGDMPGWNTFDVSAGKDFDFRSGLILGLRAYAGNINDCRYELVSGYPMPGRRFMCGIELKF